MLNEQQNQDFQHKLDKNMWDNSPDLIRLLKEMREGKWSWLNNSKHKYLNIRLDTRTGSFIFLDDSGKRVSFDEVAFQRHPGGGLSWKALNNLLED